jgi:tetratricopeptide (TPR) repeat protein
MWFWIIPLALIVISVCTLLFVLWKKIPQLRAIDVASIPTERSKQIKENIIRSRVERMGSEKVQKFVKAGGVAFNTIAKMGRRAVQRLYKMEQYYQKLKQAPSGDEHALDPQTVRRLLDEAIDLVREGEYIPAEKHYIEVISHNPKLVEAYEGLGNLYMKNKSYGQARETFAFTLRLSPNDASVHMSMADLERAEGNLKASLEHLRLATQKRSSNPKYLDAYIETALEVGAAEDARKAVTRMKEVNPDNTKIVEWEAKLQLAADSSQKV